MLWDPTPADTPRKARQNGTSKKQQILTSHSTEYLLAALALFIWHRWHPERHKETKDTGEITLQILTPIYLVEVKNIYSYRYLGNNGVVHSLRQTLPRMLFPCFSLPEKDLILWKYWSFGPLHLWSPSGPLRPGNCSTWSCKVFWSGLLDLGCILSWSVVIQTNGILIYLYLVVKLDPVHGKFHTLYIEEETIP